MPAGRRLGYGGQQLGGGGQGGPPPGKPMGPAPGMNNPLPLSPEGYPMNNQQADGAPMNPANMPTYLGLLKRRRLGEASNVG